MDFNYSVSGNSYQLCTQVGIYDENTAGTVPPLFIVGYTVHCGVRMKECLFNWTWNISAVLVHGWISEPFQGHKRGYILHLGGCNNNATSINSKII